LAVAGCALASRYLPITNHTVLITAAASPYLLFAAPVAAVLLNRAWRWIPAVIAGALTVAAVLIHNAPNLGRDDPPTSGVQLRVMSANVRLGWADAAHLVRSARENADIVALQELTSQEIDRLSASGLDSAFPYRWLDPGTDADGIGIWSRLPIHNTKRIGEFMMPFVSAQIRVPGISVDSTIVAAHIAGPWPQPIDG
jgi:endonuclease/exonuclease/phosphatase (EEP) superfamily protein YafD